MSEKDQRILELQTKLDITVADMEREIHLQKHSHALDKTGRWISMASPIKLTAMI
jgi:hypothetical protein